MSRAKLPSHPGETISLWEQHREVLELIGWMDPTLKDIVTLLDRFARVHEEGPAQFSGQLARVATRPRRR